MRLLHYSPTPISELRSVEQTAEPPMVHMKPRGLWLSVEGEDDWPSFCEGASFLVEDFVYEVVLAAEPNILYLSSAIQLDEFTKQYGVPDHILRHRLAISWPRVAQKYNGILIPAYIHERRMDMFTGWYYTWDCASGCIWNRAAIAAITLQPSLKEVTGAPPQS